MPLDGSDMAETVLPHVEKLAQLLSLETVLLRVVRVAPRSYGGHAGMPLDTAKIEQSLENEAKEYLTTVEMEITAKGMTCRTKVMHGVPWDKIVAFAGKAKRYDGGHLHPWPVGDPTAGVGQRGRHGHQIIGVAGPCGASSLVCAAAPGHGDDRSKVK